MSYFDERRKKLGLTTTTVKQESSGDDDYFARRKMELGVIPDTRPKVTPKAPEGTDFQLQSIKGESNKKLAEIEQMRQESQKKTTSMPVYYFDKVKERIPNAPMEELPGRDIPVLGSVLKAVDFVSRHNAPSNALSEQLMPDAPYIGRPGTNVRQDFLERSGQEPSTGAAKLFGQILAPAFVPGAGLGTGKGLYQALAPAAEMATAKLGTGLGARVSTEAVKEAVVGAGLGAGQALATGDGNLKDVATNAAMGAGLGAVTGAAAPAIGAALKNSKIGQSLVRMVARKNEVPAETEAAVKSVFERAEPKRSNLKGNLKIGNQETYINKVMSDIRDDVYQRITPPLENQNELSKWVQSHMGEDISLNEIRKLSYDDLSELANEIKNSMSMYDVAGRVARERGYNLDDILNGKLPNVQDRVKLDASKRVAGVYDAPKIDFARTEPNTKISIPRQNAVVQQSAVSAVPETPIRPAEPTPTVTRLPQGQQERGFIGTLKSSDKIPEEVSGALSSKYTPITNEQMVGKANKRIDKDLDEAAAYVMGNSRTTSEKITTGLRLIDEFTAQGNHSRAVEIAEKLAEEGTRAGQSVQAFSIYNRLSPEGLLIHANRVAQRATENLPRAAEAIKVTPEMSQNITDLAQTTKAMTGVKDLANDVMSILDKAKSGEKLSDVESSTLQRFVQESKQFVKEVERKPRAPRPPRQPNDKRVRDNLVSFLDAQEQAAKERLRARGIRISSTPLDVWADYAVIGAAKMAKGAIKFADWSEQMVKDLGEEIRPHLENLYNRASETFDMTTKKISKTAISNAERLTDRVIKTKQLDEVTANNLRTMARKVTDLSGDAKNLASQDLQVILQQLERPTLGRKISTVQTTAQLFNPKTQVRNALGNELFYRVERMNKIISTPIDWARSALTGSQRTVTFRTNNQGQYWKNFIAGGRAGWKGVNVNGLQTQFDLQGLTFRSKWNPLSYVEKSLGASLKAFDTAAYMRAVNETIGEMATLRAINEGLSGAERKAAIEKYIREADENILSIADEYGRYVTFQDNNIVSKGLMGLKRGLNVGRNFGIGDLVLKYPKTPGAIVMRALEYSPVGFLRSAKIAAEPFLKRSVDPNPREATMALSRAIMGTAGLTGLGYFLMDQGIITGAASKDRDVRDLQRSAGQGQYQVNLSALSRWVKSGFNKDAAKLQEGDNLYTYDWMQPVAIAVSMGANIRKNQMEGDKATSGLIGTAYDSAAGGINTLVEQSVLSGLKSAVEGYPGQTVTDKIVDIISDVPSSFVPTVLNQIRQYNDNTKRETYDPNKLQQSLNYAKSKVPGLASSLPPQYDTLGNKKKTVQDNSLFNVFLNPGSPSKYKLSPEAEFIVNLINETGDESLAPRVPAKNIDGEKLTNEQFSELQRLQGEETKKRIGNINPNMSTKGKVKAVDKALTNAGKAARKQLGGSK